MSLWRAPHTGRSLALEPRQHPWLRNSTITAAGGVLFAATAPFAGLDDWAAPGAVAVATASVGVGAHGYRTQLRDLEVDRATEQLCHVMGLSSPSREGLRASRWSNRWPGRPGRLVVRYPSAKLALDPNFIPRITEVLSGQMWGDYRVSKHHHKQCRIVFVPEIRSDNSAEQPAVSARAKRTILTLLGPTGRVTKTEFDPNTGELVALEATHEAGVKLAPSGYRARIERTASANLPGRWRARWNLETDWVRFEVRPTFDPNVWHPAITLDEDFDPLVNYDAVRIPYGIDEDGNVMSWRPAVDPNVMLVGAPGTGKTVTAHTLLTEIAYRAWIVWVADGKGVEFLGYQDWPNVQIVASRIEHQVAVIHRAWQVMEERYDAIVSGNAKETDFEPLVLFVDEFADIRGNLLNWYSTIKGKGDPTKPRTLQEIASIGRKGRTARVHLIIGTQRPDAEYFGGDMRDNFRMRVSMGRLSPQGAMMMWESPAIGTTIPRGCRGRATTINDANRDVEIQTYRTPDPRKVGDGDEGYELFEILHPPVTRHERLVILDPEPDPVDIDTGDSTEEVEIRFHDYAQAPWGRAADNPLHDPVAQRDRKHIGPIRGANPMSVLGLDEGQASSNSETRMASLLADAVNSPHRPELSVVPGMSDDDVDDWEGFSEPESRSPGELQVGDLILVDEETDQWAVIDSDPGPDEFDDDDHIAITWRGDGDVEGVISMPYDSEIACRKPLELSS